MRNKTKRMLAFILGMILSFQLGVSAFGADKATVESAVKESAAYMYKAVSKPEVGSIGGEWAVIGLARSGYNVPDSYYEEYYNRVVEYVKDCGGILHDKKYTEYSRIIVALSSIGYDARDVGGYDLTKPLGDFNKTIWQGINGPIWALIALDTVNYPMPVNRGAAKQATRELYIQEILRRQLSDGGWNLSAGANGKSTAGEKGDPDITGMALQALAKYQEKEEVRLAIDKALIYLSLAQNDSGGYSSWNSVNSESAVQVLTALCELGIPVDDSRFVKNGNTVTDNILSFKNSDGSFKHTYDGGGESQMASEQAFYGITAAWRIENGMNSLYRMGDVEKRAVSAKSSQTISVQDTVKAGLPEKHSDVKAPFLVSEDKKFEDIKNHENKTAIETLASYGIIKGKGENTFEPNATMTRAEFAQIITRGLGLSGKPQIVFTDVSPGAWYCEAVGTAYYYNIVKGVEENKFNPNATITKQEAAVMITQAAKLCGMDTNLETAEIRDMLAQFGDYTTTADWARASLAFCYKENILSQSDLNIEPHVPIKRCEVAQMLYRMLSEAQLI